MKLLFALLRLLRSATLFVLVFVVLVAVAYLLCCDQVATLSALPAGETAILAGVVSAVPTGGATGREACFRLSDPSGAIWVVTPNGPPRHGAVLIIWGRKAETDAGRAFVLETRRLGTF